MAVHNQEIFNESIANGVTTVYPYTFRLLKKDDLVVEVNGQAIGASSYVVTGIGADGGGNVIFNVPPLAGLRVMRRREVGLERLTDYQYEGDLRAETLNADLDRLWQAIQQTHHDSKRAIKLPFGTTTDQTIAATQEQRVGKVVGFDENGNAVVTDNKGGGGSGGGVNLVPWPISPAESSWARLKDAPLPSVPLATIDNETASILGNDQDGYVRFGAFQNANSLLPLGAGRYFHMRNVIEGNGTIDVLAWDGTATRLLVRLKKSPAGRQVFDGADLSAPISGLSWTDWQPMAVELGGRGEFFEHQVAIKFSTNSKQILVAEVNDGDVILIRLSHDSGFSAANVTINFDPSWPLPSAGLEALEDSIPAMLKLPAGVKKGDILVRTGPAGEQATYRGLHYDIAINGAPAAAVVIDPAAGVVSAAGGIEEAPIDGMPYARVDGAWRYVGDLGMVRHLDAQLTTKTVGDGGDFEDFAAAALWAQTVIGQYLWLKRISDLPPVDNGTIFTFPNFDAVVIESQGFISPAAGYRSAGSIVLADQLRVVGAAYQSLQLFNLSYVAPFPVPVDIDADTPSGMTQIDGADFPAGVGITVNTHGSRLMIQSSSIGGFTGEVAADNELWLEASIIGNTSAKQLTLQNRSTVRLSHFPLDSDAMSAVISISDGCVIGGVNYSRVTSPLHEVVTGAGSWRIGGGGDPSSPGHAGKFTTFTTRTVNQITQEGLAIVGDLPVP